MAISSDTRTKLRIAVQNIESADEIVDNIDIALSNASNFAQNFVTGDWIASDGNDLYSIDIVHNLNTLSPEIKVYEIDAVYKQVIPHLIRIINNNTIRISVSRIDVDCRFSGRTIIDK